MKILVIILLSFGLFISCEKIGNSPQKEKTVASKIKTIISVFNNNNTIDTLSYSYNQNGTISECFLSREYRYIDGGHENKLNYKYKGLYSYSPESLSLNIYLKDFGQINYAGPYKYNLLLDPDNKLCGIIEGSSIKDIYFKHQGLSNSIFSCPEYYIKTFNGNIDSLYYSSASKYDQEVYHSIHYEYSNVKNKSGIKQIEIPYFVFPPEFIMPMTSWCNENLIERVTEEITYSSSRTKSGEVFTNKYCYEYDINERVKTVIVKNELSEVIRTEYYEYWDF